MMGGFVEIDPSTQTKSVSRSRVLVEEAGNWSCNVVSYGFTNRNPQPAYGRVIKHFQA